MHALKGERLRADILDMLQQFLTLTVAKYYGDGDVDGLRDEVLRTLAFDFEMDRETFVKLGEDGVIDHVYEGAVAFYQAKRRALARPFLQGVRQMMESDAEDKPSKLVVQFTDGRKVIRAVCDVEITLESDGYEINDALERVAMLATIDEKWTDHLRELDELKSGIGLRAFGQKDPLLEYKMEAFGLFQQMLEDLNKDVVSLALRAGPLAQGAQRSGDRAPVRGRARGPRLDRSRAQATHESSGGYAADLRAATGNAGSAAHRDPTAKAQPITADAKIGRNDPCPCGSGKKYKQCHGRG